MSFSSEILSMAGSYYSIPSSAAGLRLPKTKDSDNALMLLGPKITDLEKFHPYKKRIIIARHDGKDVITSSPHVLGFCEYSLRYLMAIYLLSVVGTSREKRHHFMKEFSPNNLFSGQSIVINSHEQFVYVDIPLPDVTMRLRVPTPYKIDSEYYSLTRKMMNFILTEMATSNFAFAMYLPYLIARRESGFSMIDADLTGHLSSAARLHVDVASPSFHATFGGPLMNCNTLIKTASGAYDNRRTATLRSGLFSFTIPGSDIRNYSALLKSRSQWPCALRLLQIIVKSVVPLHPRLMKIVHATIDTSRDRRLYTCIGPAQLPFHHHTKSEFGSTAPFHVISTVGFLSWNPKVDKTDDQFINLLNLLTQGDTATQYLLYLTFRWHSEGGSETHPWSIAKIATKSSPIARLESTLKIGGAIGYTNANISNQRDVETFVNRALRGTGLASNLADKFRAVTANSVLSSGNQLAYRKMILQSFSIVSPSVSYYGW